MKKNLLLRLCLILMVALTIYSCRTDQFPEKETYDNSSAFQLSAKTISLEQSKDKEKLLSVISGTASDLKKLTSPALGNEIVVDTDHVVYIENGPNYHTYTFNIKRENAPEDAPLENLVLSPLTDGTYRKLLFTYHLTPQEKQTIMMGGFLDTKDKITIAELGTEAYPGVFQKQETCFWKTITIPIPCVNGHRPGQKCDLTGGQRPYLLTQSFYVCEEGYIGEGGGSGEGSPGGGGCSPNGALTGPQIPNDEMGMTPCGGGIPSLPNLPNPEDPCEKIKTKMNESEFKQKFQSLTNPANFALDHEVGFFEKNGELFPSASDPCDYELKATTNVQCITGIMHTHPTTNCQGEQKDKTPSPGDIAIFLNIILPQAQSCLGNMQDAYSLTITPWGNYMLKYNNSSLPSNTNFDMDNLFAIFNRQIQRLADDKRYTSENVEKTFTKFINDYMNVEGLEVYKVTENSSVKLDYDPATGTTTKTPCPNF